MKKDIAVKIIVGLSLLTLVSLAVYYRTDYLIFFISVVSSIIQIILFALWYLEDQTLIRKIDINVNEVKEYLVKKDRNNYREKIIRKIINKGVIDEHEITKILASLEKKDLIFISLSECKIPKGLLTEKINQYPLRSLLKEIGFVPIFYSFNPNIYVTFKEDLPKWLREIKLLEQFISKELSNIWDLIKNHAQTDFPHKFEKWKAESGFKASYVISKSLENDFKIIYKQKHTYSEDFITKILKEISLEKLRKAIPNKVQVKEIICKISFDILLDSIDNVTRNELIKNEKVINENFKIKSFLDFRNININELIIEFKKYLSEENAKVAASKVIEESKQYYEEINSMDLMIS